MKKLTDYEREQVEEIRKWKEEAPGVISKAFDMAAEPFAWFVQKIVPQGIIEGALGFTKVAKPWRSDIEDIKREEEVEKISDLRKQDLKRLDRLANGANNGALGVAVTAGTATGAGGVFATPIDVPAVIAIALQAVHKIGLCYGYECIAKHDREFLLAIMAVSGANSTEEKIAALTALRVLEVVSAKEIWKSMNQWEAQRPFSQESLTISIRNLAKQLGINLVKRRSLASIPAFGALTGGSVNGWYLNDVGWAARRAFQERWLIENKKMMWL
jgi:hypothetical protein